MLTRAFLAIGAWLLGVVGATGGSLVAVSLIGQSIAGPPTQQLTVAAVNRALAASGKGADGAPSASPTAPARRPAAPGRRHHHRAAAPSPSVSAGTSTPAATLLSSAGGTALAVCQAGDAYLVSWSPEPGYAADDVVRGPAASARVLFIAGDRGVRMTVSCIGPMPSATVAPVRDDDGGGGGWDDGGGSHDS
jgi:serine/threonine-protein kinase